MCIRDRLNIDLHFLNFQNNKSSDNYSNRVFNGAIYIAEHDDDPDHLMSCLLYTSRCV